MKKIKIFIIIFITVFLIFLGLKKGFNLGNDNIENCMSILDSSNVYDNKIIELIEAERLKETEQRQIEIQSSNGEKLVVTDKDINFIKIISNDENSKQIAIENRIFSNEAKERNIELNEREKNEIETIVNAPEIVNYLKINNITDGNEFQDRLQVYLTETKLKYALRHQINEEIFTGKLSISDIILDEKMSEYNKLQDDFKLNSISATQEEKEEYLKNASKLFMEISNRYEELILEKYIVEENKNEI